ncbi:hypothetical protein ACJMK2_002828, partial [Sinanodonta woodiana]
KKYEAREPLNQQITSRTATNSSQNDAFGAALKFAQTEFNYFWINNFQNVGKGNWTLLVNETIANNTLFDNQTNGKQHNIHHNTSWADIRMDCFDAVIDSMNINIYIIGVLTAVLLTSLFESSISTLCVMSRKKYQYVTDEETPLLSN